MGWLKGGVDKKALVNLSLHTFFYTFGPTLSLPRPILSLSNCIALKSPKILRLPPHPPSRQKITWSPGRPKSLLTAQQVLHWSLWPAASLTGNSWSEDLPASARFPPHAPHTTEEQAGVEAVERAILLGGRAGFTTLGCIALGTLGTATASTACCRPLERP